MADLVVQVKVYGSEHLPRPLPPEDTVNLLPVRVKGTDHVWDLYRALAKELWQRVPPADAPIHCEPAPEPWRELLPQIKLLSPSGRELDLHRRVRGLGDTFTAYLYEQPAKVRLQWKAHSQELARFLDKLASALSRADGLDKPSVHLEKTIYYGEIIRYMDCIMKVGLESKLDQSILDKLAEDPSISSARRQLSCILEELPTSRRPAMPYDDYVVAFAAAGPGGHQLAKEVEKLHTEVQGCGAASTAIADMEQLLEKILHNLFLAISLPQETRGPAQEDALDHCTYLLIHFKERCEKGRAALISPDVNMKTFLEELYQHFKPPES